MFERIRNVDNNYFDLPPREKIDTYDEDRNVRILYDNKGDALKKVEIKPLKLEKQIGFRSDNNV